MSIEGNSGPLLAARPSLVGSVSWIAAVALFYFAVARFSLSLVFQPEGIAAIWPGSGIFLSAILLTRRKTRPWLVGVLFLTDWIAQMLTGAPWVVTLLYALTGTGTAVLSSWLLLRFVGGPITFGRIREVLGWLLLSVILSHSLGALGAAAASRLLPGASFWNSWRWWAASDGIGNLLATPLILSWAAWARARRRVWKAKRALEGAALFILLAVFNWLGFRSLSGHAQFSLLLTYATLPFLLWAALRFGVRGVASASVILAGIAIRFAAAGRITNILLQGSALDVVVTVQLYVAIIAGPPLFLALVVTERRRAEEALRESERWLKEAQAIGKIGSWEFDVESRKIIWSDQTYKLYDRDPALGPPTAEEEAAYYSSGQARILREHARQVVEEGKDIDHDLEAMLPGGKQVFLSTRMRPVKDEHGRVTRVWGTVQDITERKRTEAEVAQLRQRLEFILGSTKTGLDIIDANHNVRYVDPEWQKVYGDPKGRKCYEYFIGAQAVCPGCGIVKALTTRKTAVSEVVLPKEGNRPVQVTTIPFQDENGEWLFAEANVDITERKQAEEALHQSHEQLRALAGRVEAAREEERTRIAREAHDELGQTLVALKMDLDWVVKRLPEGEVAVRGKTGSILRLVDDLIGTVRRICSELRPGLLDDLGLVPALDWQAREFARRTGLECELDLGGKDVVLERGLATALFRIFQETLTNVSRHAGATRIRVALDAGSDELSLTVSDNGKGITGSQASDPESLGVLGIRERIRPWGGDATFRGVAGQGTTVTVRVPMA